MSDEPSSSAIGDDPSPSLTVADYRAQAAAICEEANTQNDRMPEGSLTESIEFAQNTARIGYDALNRLKPPPEFAQQHAEVIELIRALLEDFSPLVEAAESGMTAYLQASSHEAERMTRTSEQVREIWKTLGVPACYEPHN